MLLYLVAPDSSRILRSLVYKQIGLAFRGVVFEKRVRVYCSVTKVTCKVWQRPCLLKCDSGRVYTAVSRKVVGKSARDSLERYCG